MKANIILIEASESTVYFIINPNAGHKNTTFIYETFGYTLSVWVNNMSKWVLLKDFNLMSEEELFQESLVNDMGICVYLLANIQKELKHEYDYFIINKRLTIEY